MIPYWLHILIGFVFIFIGAYQWTTTHIVEKHFEQDFHYYHDGEGGTSFQMQSQDIFKNYRIVRKDEVKTEWSDSEPE